MSVTFFCASAQHKKVVGELSDGMTWLKKDRKFGFLNEKGTLVIPFKYDSVFSFTEGLAAVKLDSNWFYIDKKDRAVQVYIGWINDSTQETGVQYWEKARPYYNGIAVVKYFGDAEYSDAITWNAIDTSGNWALGDFGADSLGDFVHGYAEVVYGDTHGIIDILGDELVPIQYQAIDSFSNGWVKAKLNDQWFVLNPYGECAWNCPHGELTTAKRSSSYSTIRFPNIVRGKLFDGRIKHKIKALIAFMERNPNQRMVVIGNGNSSYVSSQTSWDYVYGIINYVVTHSKVKREQFIFQYGRSGLYRTVNIRKAKPEEDGHCNLPPPFPNLSKLYKDGIPIVHE